MMYATRVEARKLNNGAYDFGARLKKLRQAAKYSQNDVAKRLGVTVGTIRKYERNTSLPPVDKLETMAIMFRTSLDYLRNLDKRSSIFIDDLPIAQQELIKAVVNNLKKELQMYDRSK